MEAKGKRDFRWEVRSQDKNKVPKMEELFKQMWKVYDDYIRLEKPDLPFWSTEWNLVGHMAVAASKLGPVTLEYSEKKPRGKRTRRPDAWFRMSMKPNDTRDLLIEAKRVELSLHQDSKFISGKIKPSFQSCKSYLGRFDDCSWRSPMIFLQPYIPSSSTTEAVYDQAVEKFIRSCGQALKQSSGGGKNSFYAYYFLEWSALVKSEKYYYPGVAIFGDLQKVK